MTNHHGQFEYWKPKRVRSYAAWSRIAFRIAWVSVLLIFLFAAIATIVMLSQL